MADRDINTATSQLYDSRLLRRNPASHFHTLPLLTPHSVFSLLLLFHCPSRGRFQRVSLLYFCMHARNVLPGIIAFWNVTSSNFMDRYQSFLGTFCLHLQGSHSALPSWECSISNMPRTNIMLVIFVYSLYWPTSTYNKIQLITIIKHILRYYPTKITSSAFRFRY